MYHIDNCSIIENRGAFIQSHVDLHDSANTFYWKFWSCTFKVLEHQILKHHKFIDLQKLFIDLKIFSE